MKLEFTHRETFVHFLAHRIFVISWDCCIAITFSTISWATKTDVKALFKDILLVIKPGLHEPQLQVEWSVAFLYSLVLERRC